jgi:NhaP-type Na+/H+ or K+/H+ antiporter
VARNSEKVSKWSGRLSYWEALFAHLAVTAFLADSLRCSGVMAAALAGPPFRPPLRPMLERYCLNSSGSLLAIPGLYVTGSRSQAA